MAEPGRRQRGEPGQHHLVEPPYYGYAEPLQYLPQHTDVYTESQWNKVITWRTITGTVTFNGRAGRDADVWVYLPGGDAYTAADGAYTLNHIPIGSYNLKAQAVITTNGLSAEYTNGGGQTVTLTAGESNISQNIALQGLPQNYRRFDATYSISCDHGDANPFNGDGVQTAGRFAQSAFVNPGQVVSGLGYTFDYNGGGYFKINYNFAISLLEDLSIEVTLTQTMYNAGSSNAVYSYTAPNFNVPAGGNRSGSTTIEYSNGYHNGPAVFTFSVSNNQQTG